MLELLFVLLLVLLFEVSQENASFPPDQIFIFAIGSLPIKLLLVVFAYSPRYDLLDVVLSLIVDALFFINSGFIKDLSELGLSCGKRSNIFNDDTLLNCDYYCYCYYDCEP